MSTPRTTIKKISGVAKLPRVFYNSPTMDFNAKLTPLGLSPSNCVVIGSGILDILGLRKSHDIDLVVTQSKYQALSKDKQFQKKRAFGCNILTNGISEIGTAWNVLGKKQRFEDLLFHSTVIKNTRFITLEFLLKVKRSWLQEKKPPREKDVADVRLISEYLQHRFSHSPNASRKFQS